MTGSEQLVEKLRRSLPHAAYGQPPLAATLRRRFPRAHVMARLVVTDEYYAGEERGLMCRIDAQGVADQPISLFTPITHPAFDRRTPIASDFTNCGEQRTILAAIRATFRAVIRHPLVWLHRRAGFHRVEAALVRDVIHGSRSIGRRVTAQFSERRIPAIRQRRVLSP